MTFEEMILDCAERWGVADESGTTAAIPTDTAILEKVKRKLNAGYREFLTAWSKWTFCEELFQITTYPSGDGPLNIAADAGRYRLPGYIASSPRGDWTFTGTSAPRRTVLNIAHQLIRQKRVMIQARGVPQYCGCGPIDGDGPPGADEKAWEVVFWPSPGAIYTLEASFRIDAHTLDELTERHVAGRAHDRTIIAFADWEWYRDDAEDEGIRDRYKADRDERLKQSIAADNERRTREHGNANRSSGSLWGRRRQPKTHWPLGRVTFEGSQVQ